MKLHRNRLLINHSKLLVGLLVIVSMFSQCAIQKRVHQKGWYVSFRKPIHASANSIKTKQTLELAVVDSVHTIASDSPELVRQTTVPLLFQDSIVESQVEVLPVAESLGQISSVVADTLKKGSQHKQRSKAEKEPNLKRQKTIKTIVISVYVLLMLTMLIAGFISLTATGTVLQMLGFTAGLFFLVLLLLILAISEPKRKKNNAKRIAEKKGKKTREIKRKPTEEELVQLKKERRKHAILLTIVITVFVGLILFFTLPTAELPFLIFSFFMYTLLLIAVWSFAWRKSKPIEITVIEESEEPEVIVAPDKPKLSDEELRKKKLKKAIFGYVFLAAIVSMIVLYALSQQ